VKDWIYIVVVSLILSGVIYVMFAWTSEDQAAASLNNQFPSNNECINLLTAYSNMTDGTKVLKSEAKR
jgi:hypothetical protein